MPAWTNGVNDDGLFIKFGPQEADKASGGVPSTGGDHETIVFDLDWTELLSVTDAIVGSVGNPGAFGVLIPEGALITQLDTEVTEAFTSSGTVADGTVLIGTKKQDDRSTELDHNGLLTAAATIAVVGGAALGSTTSFSVGVTGAGAQMGTVLTEEGVITASNSAHATVPYTAGNLRVSVTYRMPGLFTG